MLNLTEYAKDYTSFVADIDLVDEAGCAAHMLDITLTDPDTPGSITVEWNGGTEAPRDKLAAESGDGISQAHAIHRSGPLIGRVRKITAATGIAVVRAHWPFKARA